MKNYSTIRSILKREQGEKIAPYIFKDPTPKLFKNIWTKKELPTKFTVNSNNSNRSINTTYQEDISGRS